MKKFSYIAAIGAVFPMGAAAASISNLDNIFTFIKNTLNTILPLIIALAVVYFIWGIFRFVMAGDEEAKAAAKDKIIYGVIGLFVMVSVWGLVNILVNTFGLTNTTPTNITGQLPNIPQ